MRHLAPDAAESNGHPLNTLLAAVKTIWPNKEVGTAFIVSCSFKTKVASPLTSGKRCKWNATRIGWYLMFARGPVRAQDVGLGYRFVRARFAQAHAVAAVLACHWRASSCSSLAAIDFAKFFQRHSPCHREGLGLFFAQDSKVKISISESRRNGLSGCGAWPALLTDI